MEDNSVSRSDTYTPGTVVVSRDIERVRTINQTEMYIHQHGFRTNARAASNID